jgi:hypothetical protein
MLFGATNGSGCECVKHQLENHDMLVKPRNSRRVVHAVQSNKPDRSSRTVKLVLALVILLIIDLGLVGVHLVLHEAVTAKANKEPGHSGTGFKPPTMRTQGAPSAHI